MSTRSSELDAQNREYYGGVAVLAQEGMDAIDAKLVALSNLPQDFDRQSMTNMIMYGIALAFGYTADEFWPVQYGALGRSRETEIHHMRATAKGGSDYVLGFQEKIQHELPPTVYFEFDKRDGQTDILEAEVFYQWGRVSELLYNQGEGPLDREEIRNLLFQKNIVPKEVSDAVESHVATSMGVNRNLNYVRDEILGREQILRAVMNFPRDPIVSYSFTDDKTTLLWEKGEDALSRSLWHVPLNVRTLYGATGGRDDESGGSDGEVFPLLDGVDTEGDAQGEGDPGGDYRTWSLLPQVRKNGASVLHGGYAGNGTGQAGEGDPPLPSNGHRP